MTMDSPSRHTRRGTSLLGYMDGSAAAIGEMMLPILEPSDPAALPRARTSATRSSSRTSCATSARTSTAGGSTSQSDLRRYGAHLLAERALQRLGRSRPRSGRPSCVSRSGAAATSTCRGTSGSACCLTVRPVARAARLLYSRILDTIEARLRRVHGAGQRAGLAEGRHDWAGRLRTVIAAFRHAGLSLP